MRSGEKRNTLPTRSSPVRLVLNMWNGSTRHLEALRLANHSTARHTRVSTRIESSQWMPLTTASRESNVATRFSEASLERLSLFPL